MPYNGKTDWKLNEMVYPEDMNRIEGQIEKNTSEIEGVSGKIGNPSDNEDQLTLFGKLAALLKKVMGIDDKVGTSSDADTQPTLFGRLAQLKNVLLEKLAELLTKVTRIDTKIGTSGDTAETATLFGQLFQIKKDTKDTEMYVLSNTLQKTILSKELSATYTAATFLGSFYAEKTGLIFVEANMKNGSDTRAAVIVPISTEDMYYTTKNGGTLSFSSTINETVEGLTQMPNQGDSIYGSYVSYALDLNYTHASKILYCNKTSYASRKHAMSVRKGNLYLFFLTNIDYVEQTVYCNSLKLYYDVKEVNEI